MDWYLAKRRRLWSGLTASRLPSFENISDVVASVRELPGELHDVWSATSAELSRTSGSISRLIGEPLTPAAG
jgi:hypothetical protein